MESYWGPQHNAGVNIGCAGQHAAVHEGLLRRDGRPPRRDVAAQCARGYPANGSSNRRIRFAVVRRSSRSHCTICSLHRSRLVTRGADTRTGGVGRPMASRTVLTFNFNRLAISFFGTFSTRCSCRISAH